MLVVDVTNTSDVIDGVTGVVVGLDPTWVQLVLPVVSLFPESTGTLTFRFDVPPSCPAGEIPLMVRVFSTIDASIVSEHDVMLVVEPIEAAELTMRPSLVNGGSEAQMSAVVTNTGNVPTEFRVEALEPTRALECTVDPPTVVVPPGEERAVVITARGRRPWFGNPVNRTITVEAFSPTLELTTTGRFNQRPRIARGVVTALILVGIILLWAAIFLWVIDALSSQAAATKKVNDGFLSGDVEFAMENIGGQVSGRVTAATTEQGLERITVEAYRVDQNGNQGDVAASTATAEDGTYLLESLVPGIYRVRFTAEGFEEAWCENRTGGLDLTVQPVDPDIPSVRCSAAIEGLSGSLTIAVALPPGASGDATVTVQQVVAGDAEQPAAVTAVKLPEPPANTYFVDGLVTPAQYEVTIAFAGFEPFTTVVEVGGGDQTVLDPSTLAAQPGVIGGTVRDGSGQGLGNVTITLRNGPLELTILSPTLGGSVGAFRFEDLPTPGNYVITFEREGYDSWTEAVALTAGGSVTNLSPQLTAGQGTLSGTVSATGPNGTSTLGGVVVTVTGLDFTSKTATLTGSVGNGTYTISGLPTPGVYSVSFAAPGFLTEYTTVQYVAAGQQVRNITLVRSVAQLRGTVRVDGVATGGIFVELSNGATVRSTTSAASPAGAFSFLDVAPGSYTLTFWAEPPVPGGQTQVPLATVQVTVTAGQLWQQTIDVPGGGP